MRQRSCSFLPGRIVGLGIFLLALLGTAPVAAEWVRATGQAAIVNGDRQGALAAARDNALREAALKLRARIASEDTVENGVLTHSRLTVHSSAQAREVRVISERIDGGFALVTVAADMVTGGACMGSAGGDSALPDMRKRVAVAGFTMVDPRMADLGKLYNAERALPQYLYQQLQAGGAVEPFAATQRQMYGEIDNAPTVWEADNRVTKTLDLARDMEVQFVIAGVIREMAPVADDAWGDSLLSGWQRGLGLSNRNRRFVMDIVVHDGFSGSPVMERRYQTAGLWTADKDADVGFLTPDFLATPYGQAVAGLLREAAADIAAELRCQPYMTRITRVEDRRVYLASGAASGIRPGQELQIYRRFEFIDTPGNTYELRPTAVNVRIDQVHPEFSSGLIPVEAGRRNIQQDDIAIIW